MPLLGGNVNHRSCVFSTDLPRFRAQFPEDLGCYRESVGLEHGRGQDEGRRLEEASKSELEVPDQIAHESTYGDSAPQVPRYRLIEDRFRQFGVHSLRSVDKLRDGEIDRQ